MKNYVVGFAFSYDDKILLIKKNRPKWQAGRLNGIGGHIEENEAPKDTILREAQEEANLTAQWKLGAMYHGRDYIVYFFYTFCSFDNIKKMTDEELVIINKCDLYKQNTIYNLQWLIPLMQDVYIEKPINVVEITEHPTGG